MVSILLPLIAITALAVLAVAAASKRHSRQISVIATALYLIGMLFIFAESVLVGAVSHSEQYTYLTILSQPVALGFNVSSIQLMLLLMSSIVLFATALSGNPEREHEKASNLLILLFQIAAIGLFSTTSLLAFFIFWDIGVIAMFFMIDVLGSANRRKAATNFLLYEIFASAMLLLGIILIYFYTPVHSFDIPYILSNVSSIPAHTQELIFIVLFAAFMVNMPLFPTHFWLPDAHTEASTQGSMLLSGVLTKFGAYGMLILFTTLPIASSFAVPVAVLAIFSTFYSVFVLMHQTDIKRVIAYSTIVELGIVMLGISSMTTFGTYGAVFAMLAHGFTVSLMFLSVGSLKHIFGERDINLLKGSVSSARSTTYTFFLGTLSMLGFPLTATFVADILIFLGTISAFGIYGALSLLALIFMGGYMYFVINKSMFYTGTSSEPVNYIGPSQKAGYAILLFCIFIFGILPFAILNLVSV